jgi:peptidoglycan hydrolase-like protein with peptidoglycan-binding domain
MRTAKLWVAFLGAFLAISDTAPAQNVAAPAAAAPEPGPIAAAQQQLQREGYSPGPANGVMTEPTRRAIAAYAARTGKPPDALAGSGPAEGPIERAQTGLQRLGLFAGRVDGVVGPQTRDAIVRFQAGRRLAIDPRVSDGLVAALDEAGVGASAAPASAPASAAAASPAPPSAAEGTPPEALGRRPLPDWLNPPAIR